MIKVGVIRVGISSEYDVSLKTGGNVISHLLNDKLNKIYKPIDILIDKDGVWYIQGKPTSIEKVFNNVDVIFNALHGDYGEDGKVQQVLDTWGIPYTGSKSFPSAVGYNKVLSKEQFRLLGIKTPKHLLFPVYQKDFDGPIEDYAIRKAKEVHSKISPPWIVKPVSSGSSMGVIVCKTFDDLIRAFNDGVNQKVSVLVEEMIEGKEATVGVIENFRGKDLYVLPSIEIRVPKENNFFDYDAKYSGKSEEICPGNFTREEKEELERLAKLIHKGLNLSHYSRSDFIVHPKRGIFVLEVNTLPGLTDESLIPKGLRAVGADVSEFIHHIISLARKSK